MTAARPAVAPDRRVRREAPAPSRPDLRLVLAPRPRTRARAVLVLSTVVVFAVLLLAAVVHTTMVSGQRELDRVDTRIAETTRQNQSLRLRVAELASPERIVEAASADGMVVPDDVTWLSPETDASGPIADPPAPSTADDVGDERAGSADETGTGGSEG